MPDDADRALSPPRPLRAGPLRALLDGVDLRQIGRSREALLDRVYVAVRAADWSTVPGTLSDLVVRCDEASFEVSFAARHQSGSLDFEWHGLIEGSSEGRITYAMEGEALTAFDYCRIGFCVLHPDWLAGAAYHARTADGGVDGHLPRLIAPQILRDGAVVPPIPVFAELSVVSADGETVHVESDGELFEMEDQRNWTDASFKSYIPPIRPGYPYATPKGQRFSQRITVGVDAGLKAHRAPPREEPVRVKLAPPSGGVLPMLGIGMPSIPVDVDATTSTLTGSLRPDHLRFDVWPGRPDQERRVDAATDQARRLGCSLEPALFVALDDAASVGQVVERLAAEQVARWAVFDAATAYAGSTSPRVVRLVREMLDARSPGATLVAGAASDFVCLNRGRTLLDGVDALAWAITPTYHADDDRSMMENALAQGVTVQTARTFAGGRALCVGPVELSRRTAPPDPRQSSPLAAAWAVASLADLCAASPDSITYFETVGPRGLVAPTGEPFPVYRVFEQLAGMRGRPVRIATSSSRRDVAGVAVERDDGLVGFLANLTDRCLCVSLEPVARPITSRVLRPGGTVDVDVRLRDSRFELDLDPYDTVLLG